MMQSFVCTTQGITLFACNDDRCKLSRRIDVSKIVASISCLITKIDPFDFDISGVHIVVVPCILSSENVTVYSVFCVEQQDTDSVNEMYLRAAYVASKMKAEYQFSLLHVVSFLDRQSAFDLHNSTFLNREQSDSNGSDSDGGGLSEELLETVFGDNAELKENFAALEDHLLRQAVVLSPDAASLSDQWVGEFGSLCSELADSLHLFDCSPASHNVALSGLYLFQRLTSRETLHPIFSRQLLRQTDCGKFTLIAAPLESEWAELLRMHHQTRQADGEECSSRVVTFTAPISLSTSLHSVLMTSLSDDLAVAVKLPHCMLTPTTHPYDSDAHAGGAPDAVSGSENSALRVQFARDTLAPTMLSAYSIMLFKLSEAFGGCRENITSHTNMTNRPKSDTVSLIATKPSPPANPRFKPPSPLTQTTSQDQSGVVQLNERNPSRPGRYLRKMES